MEDLSWISDADRLLNINANCPPELMTRVSVSYIFINTNSEIAHIIKETESLENGGISFNRVARMVQDKKLYQLKRYVISDILIYNIETGPYIESTVDPLTCGPIREIILPPSLFIFHKLNQILIFMHETKPKHTRRVQFACASKSRKHIEKI